MFARVRLLTVGWNKRFSRTRGAKREDWPWWAPEKSFWDSWNESVEPSEQPSEPGRGVAALLAGPPDPGLHLHESALADEPARALPTRIITGELRGMCRLLFFLGFLSVICVQAHPCFPVLRKMETKTISSESAAAFHPPPLGGLEVHSGILVLVKCCMFGLKP